MDVFRRSFISGFVQFWSKNLSEKTELAEVGLNGKTILKFVLKSGGEEGRSSAGTGHGPSADCYERGNKLPGYMLNIYWLSVRFRKEHAVWSYLFDVYDAAALV